MPSARLPPSIADVIHHAAAQHGVRHVRLFGSHASGTARADSDIDLLVEVERGRGLLDLIAFKQDVEEATGRVVDVVAEGGLSPYLRDAILAQAVPV